MHLIRSWIGLGVGLLVASMGVDGGADAKELERTLRTGGKWERVRAVEKAAALDFHAGWELVIDALDDRAGEVADTAQLVLGRAADPWLLERLRDRDGLAARDEWVRRRVVEAVGRMPLALDVGILHRAASDRDADVRRTALVALSRQARAGRLTGSLDAARDVAAKTLRRDRDPRVRAHALDALCALDPENASANVRAAIGSTEPGVRCMAASLAPTVLDRADALTSLREIYADEDRAVRAATVDGLAALGTSGAMRLLAERLAEESTERLRWRLLDRLRAASGRKHRFDPRPWRDWAARLPDEWSASASEPMDELQPAGRSAAQFAGLPLRSDRLCFLIDLSGSIWTERADGRTPKELVDERLREALERLPAHARFNVIPFTGEPRPWADELQPATRSNVGRAARFFEQRRDRGTGNFWDAAMLALEDPQVDTLVVLTDGAPTGGRRYHLDLMIPLFVERNAVRQVAVDSVLVGAPRKLRERWAELARKTGGLSVAFPLE